MIRCKLFIASYSHVSCKVRYAYERREELAPLMLDFLKHVATPGNPGATETSLSLANALGWGVGYGGGHRPVGRSSQILSRQPDWKLR